MKQASLLFKILNMFQCPYGSMRKMNTLLDKIVHGWIGLPYHLNVITHGNPKNPTVVLLHGLAVDSDSWKEVVDVLQKSHYCITIDLLGFGASPKPQWLEYTMSQHLRSLRYTMSNLGLPKQYILIGHSLGSFLATRIALKEKRHIARLILLSPPVYPPLEQIKPRGARRLTGMLLTSYEFLRSEKMTPRLFDRISRILPLPRNVLSNPETWTPSLRTLKHCIEEQTILEDASQLTMPTDVFYGTFDQVVIGSNVRLLASNPSISLHKFIGDHFVTRAYAKVIKEVSFS